MGISTEQALKMVDGLMRFPYPSICRHYVAANILDLLERNGVEISTELARAVVRCDDETAIEELEKIR